MKIQENKMQQLTKLLEMEENTYLEEVILEWVEEEGIDIVLEECIQMHEEVKKMK